ncbi:MAG: tRNA pseudouridine(55) synthase TruB [Patescibacteria group bacterium]|nr:tRNA pseudouridine(55) synthase TruB [Patescibacteria group bacterium]
MRNLTINEISKDEFNRLTGVLLLNKPAGITSHDLVDKVRRITGIRKVGHAGTLDPFATGLMIVLIGKYTKLAEQYTRYDKEYSFELLIGATTKTLDPESEIITQKDSSSLEDKEIIKVIKSFQGSSFQTVPVFSSVKVSGVRLREYAHSSENIVIESKGSNTSVATFMLKQGSKYQTKSQKGTIKIVLPRKKITIKKISVDSISDTTSKSLDKFPPNNPALKLIKTTAKVNKGTYIRQLAKDIGVKLGGYPAMLYSLERTKIGEFSLEDVITLSELQEKINTLNS